MRAGIHWREKGWGLGTPGVTFDFELENVPRRQGQQPAAPRCAASRRSCLESQLNLPRSLLIGHNGHLRMTDGVLRQGPNIIVHGAVLLSLLLLRLLLPPLPAATHTSQSVRPVTVHWPCCLRLADLHFACDMSSESTNNSAIQMAILSGLVPSPDWKCRLACKPTTAVTREIDDCSKPDLHDHLPPSPLRLTVCNRACHHHHHRIKPSAMSAHVRPLQIAPSKKRCDLSNPTPPSLSR